MVNRGEVLHSIRTGCLWVLLMGLGGTLSGCLFDNGSEKAVGGGGESSGSTSSSGSPSVVPGGSDSGAGSNRGGFEITRVLRSNSDPASTLDLLGQPGFDFSRACISGGGTATEAQSSCVCQFNYTQTNGLAGQIQVPVIYAESTLLRCRYDLLQDVAGSVQVKVILASQVESNVKSIQLGDEVGALNLKDPASFVNVKRYQCRDHIFVPHMFDGKVYDPFQSEDNRLSYGLNFYATNLGGALSAFVLGSIQPDAVGAATSDNSFFSRWDCSMDRQNPPEWENLILYSVAADQNGSYRIYPSDDSAFDRSTFHLAKKKTGVFNVPVNALIGPSIRTTQTSPEGQTSNPRPPIGWGAHPISVAGGESCPSEQIDIGPDMEWVKVWAYRASLQTRKYVEYTEDALETGQIVCNPGKYPLSNQYVFQDCKHPDAVALRGNGILPDGGLASRVLGNTGACMNFSDNVPASVKGAPGQAHEQLNYFDIGTDYYERVGTTRLNQENFTYNMNSFGKGQSSAPYDIDMSIADLDDEQSRVDYVFVVTPTDVNISDMKNKTAKAKPYIPYSFKRKEDCDASNPNVDQNCLNNLGTKTTYDLWSSEISADPTAVDVSGGTYVYPLCAVRPKTR